MVAQSKIAPQLLMPRTLQNNCKTYQR